MKRSIRIAAGAVVLAGLAAVLALTMWSDAMSSDTGNSSPPAAAAAIPLAVLGDSNSQSYQDYHWFPVDSKERGGPLRSRTFQWTEVLARLRGQELDLGPWVRWGRPGVVARAREWLGLRGGRAPKKDDYLYNFANSGASCNNLMGSRFRQAPRLAALMDEQPERWQRGVVVIRIGLNNWGGLLDLQASNPAAPELRAATAYCAGEIGAAIALIHATHPSTRILLVGIGNEADDPDNFDRYLSASDTANIAIALDSFNAALRQIAAGNTRVAFFDDAAWFKSRWGARDADGKPDYNAVTVGSTLRVTNTAGDDPSNALLGDHHAGLAINALWAQSLVARLHEAFDLPLTPIGDDELDRFLGPLVNPPKAPGS
jgi:hypothetical protein